MKYLIFLALIILPLTLTAQTTSRSQQLEKLFHDAYANGQFNGAVLVAEKGKPVYEAAFGYADAAGHRLNVDSQFALAQVTRQFTTMAIMILKEQGKLKYSDKVRQFIPDLPYEDITIYHLLTFTDGLPYIADDLPERDKSATNGNGSTVKELVKFLIENKPKVDAQPGLELGWSGSGSILMAYIIEKVSGESYANFLEKHIFRPLKMDHTYVYGQAHNAHPKNRARLVKFAANGKDIVANDQPVSPLVGDVGIYSTLSDLLKWDRCLHNGQLVKKETLEEAFTPAKVDNGRIAEDDASRVPGLAAIGKYHYGFGWDLDTLYGSRVVFHGGFPPNGSVLFRNLDKDRIIIVLTNNSTQNSHFYHFKVFDRVLKIMNERPAEPIKKAIGDKIGSTLIVKGRKEAIDEYHRLKDSEPDVYDFNDPIELTGLGEELLAEGKVHDAAAVLKLNTLEFPDFPYAYFLLGKAYMSIQDYPAAKRALEKVIQLIPDAENSRKMLKIIEAKMNDTETTAN